MESFPLSISFALQQALLNQPLSHCNPIDIRSVGMLRIDKRTTRSTIVYIDISVNLW